MDDRYQHQTQLVKAYRWLRWKPLYFVIAFLHVARWFIHGMRPMTLPADESCPEFIYSRLDTCKCIWALGTSTAEVKMKHYYSIDETLERWGWNVNREASGRE